MSSKFRSIAAMAALLAATFAHAANDPIAVYSFNGTLTSSVAGAPALAAIDPLGLSGFSTDIVSGQSTTVYNFQGSARPAASQSGLSLDVSSLLAGHADDYSIEMVFKFTERDGDWRRIIDVTNRSSDEGLYVSPGNSLNLFPLAAVHGFTNDAYHNVLLVNDHGTATIYLDGGAPTSGSSHLMDLTATSFNQIHFFLDNIYDSFQDDYSSGSVALIRVYDHALSAPPPPLSPVPEPAKPGLLFAGLAAMGLLCRRRLKTGQRLMR